MGLVDDSTIGIDPCSDDSNPRYEVTLKNTGFTLSHDRRQELRNLRSNRSITLLTFVLAFVGMAQATALTANVSNFVTGDAAFAIWGAAGIVLVVIYLALWFRGSFNFDI